MADPINNAQFAQSLFAALPAMVRRSNEQQANIAFTSLQRRWQEGDAARRRAQQVADQESQFQKQVALSNLTSDRYRDIEQERSDLQERKTAAERKEQARRDASRAYATYTRLAAEAGETPKPIGSFGDDPEQAANSIAEEMARIQAKQEQAGVEGLATAYDRQLSSLQTLRASAELTPKDTSAAAAQVLGKMLATDTEEKSWVAAADAFRRGAIEVGLSKLGPQDRSAFTGELSKTLQDMQLVRNKQLAPQIQQKERALATLESLVIQAGLKNPKHLSALARLGEGGKADAPAPAAGRLATTKDFSALVGENGKEEEAPKPAPASVPTSTPSLIDQLDEGGIPAALPTLRRLVSLIPRVASGGLIDAQAYMRDNVQYLPGTLNYMAGYATSGKRGAARRLEQGDRERAAEAALLRQFSAPWVKTTGDAVLRSIFEPAEASR